MGRRLRQLSLKVSGGLQRLRDANGPKSELSRLRRRVQELEQLLNVVASCPDAAWLHWNRAERMDATVAELYDLLRRDFHLARYEFAAQYAKDKDLADIASGTGYGSALLRNRGAKSVVGVDLDLEAVKYARRMHAPDRVTFRCESGESTWLPDASVDMVVCVETIEHVRDDRALLKEFHRILRPEGRLICSTPNDWPVNASPTHVRTYDGAGFQEVLSECFCDITLFNQNSGSRWIYNHAQPAGITLTTRRNVRLAECFIAVCRKR